MNAPTNCCCSVDGCVHSVTSAHVDLRIDDNATWMDAFQFGEPDDVTWTLEGQNFKMDVQYTYYDPAPLLSLSTADGRILVDDLEQRVIHFNVDPADIQSNLSPGTYVYDLIMIDASTPGMRVPLMHGTVQVVKGVTYP